MKLDDHVERDLYPELWCAVNDFHKPILGIVECYTSAQSAPLSSEQKKKLIESLQSFEGLFSILSAAKLTEKGDSFPKDREMIRRYMHNYTTWFPALYDKGVISRDEMKDVAPQLYEIGENPARYPDPNASADTLRARWDKHCIVAALTGDRPSVFKFVKSEVFGVRP